jgi:hypothetical protein
MERASGIPPPSYGLGEVHNAIAIAQLAAEYLKETDPDVTRDT